MLRQCQHKLAFTKSSWYNSALKTFIPRREIKFVISWKHQYRSITSLASTLQSGDDMQATFVAPSLLPPIEPLQTGHDIHKPEVKKLVMIEKYRRCSASRKHDGHRCERLVKTDPTNPISFQVLCHIHDPSKEIKEIKKKAKRKRVKVVNVRSSENRASEETIYALIQQYSPSILSKKEIIPPQGLYNCWDLWIGEHIAEPQRTMLHQVMNRQISKRDKDGFIYVYSINNNPRESKDTHAFFKIGRTTDPHRRMYQVSYVCKMQPDVIELFPSYPVAKKNWTLSKIPETSHGALDKLKKCPLAHTVETLIHIELSSLFKRAGFKCDGCGKRHREWIRVDRRVGPNGKPMTDTELWLFCIRPVILKWIQYGVAISAVKKTE